MLGQADCGSNKVHVLCVNFFKFCSLVLPFYDVKYQVLYTLIIPLIGKDGDDVIDNITCELSLMGTESINTQIEYTYLCGKMCQVHC